MHFVKKWISVGFFLFGYFPYEECLYRSIGTKRKQRTRMKGRRTGGKGKREGGSIRMGKRMNEYRRMNNGIMDTIRGISFLTNICRRQKLRKCEFGKMRKSTYSLYDNENVE